MPSNKLRKLIAILISPVCMISCASTSITSIVRQDHSSPIQKLFILSYAGSQGSKHFLYHLDKNLSSRFSEQGINTMVHNYDYGGPTEQETLKNKIAEFKPNAILKIDQTKTTDNGGWATTGGSFELTMFEPGDSAFFWEASLWTHTGYFSTIIFDTGIPSQAADYVIKQLKKDGIIKTINKQ